MILNRYSVKTLSLNISFRKVTNPLKKERPLLTHQVYPFYENNEERISIAGNLGVIEVNN